MERNSKERIIIIGAVAAGTKAAAKARRENPHIEIALYSDGQYISYSACGIPYYIEGLFDDYKRLIVRSVDDFRKENIEVFVSHKVVEIYPEEKKIEILNLKTGEMFYDYYTKLLISTGSRPFIPPIDGINSSNIFTLRTLEDGLSIKNAVEMAKNAVIIGGGYIGVEMAEAFMERGLNVTMIERANQLLTAFDKDIADVVADYIRSRGINIILDEKVIKITNDEVITDKGTTVKRDIVLMAVGVKPDIKLAEKAGVELGKTGAINVDDAMRTNIEDIYAAGDCVEERHMITGEKVWIPLGSTANKQGRIAAINMTGGKERYRGVLGSMVTRIADFTVAKTGLSEKEAQEAGFNTTSVTITHRDRAGYMPESSKITIKMVADRVSRKLLGAQIIGMGDADKRINTVATALIAEMTVDDFLAIDLTYAPPFSPTIDGVLVAAQTLSQKMSCL